MAHHAPCAMKCHHCKTDGFVPRVVDNRQLMFRTCARGMREDRALIGLDHTTASREMIVVGCGLQRTCR